MSEATLTAKEETPCAERLARIYAYIDDPISCSDLDELQAHLAECEQCAKEYDLECIIRQAVRRTCKETAPTTLTSRIRAQIDELHADAHSAN